MGMIGASENLLVLESWGGGGNQVQGQGLGESLGKWWVWRWLAHKKLWLDLAIPRVLCSPPATCWTGPQHSSFWEIRAAPESSLWVSCLLLQVRDCNHFDSASYIILDLCLLLTQRLEIPRLDSLFHRPPACPWLYGSVRSVHQTWLSSSWPLTLVSPLSPHKLSPCSQIWIRFRCFLGLGSDQSSKTVQCFSTDVLSTSQTQHNEQQISRVKRISLELQDILRSCVWCRHGCDA